MPAHWDAAKGVLRYVKGTATLGITYGHSEVLLGYTDSDWASDRDKCCSTTGYMLLMNGRGVRWKSRLQPTESSAAHYSFVVR